MGIVEDIVTALSSSTRTTLSLYRIRSGGPIELQNPKRDIAVFQDRNQLNLETFDSEDRIKKVILFFNFKKLSYTKAHKEFDSLVSDIIKELNLNENFDYEDNMTVGDIDYGYNKSGVLNQASMELLFTVEEEYLPTEQEIKEIEMRGDMIDE